MIHVRLTDRLRRRGGTPSALHERGVWCYSGPWMVEGEYQSPLRVRRCSPAVAPRRWRARSDGRRCFFSPSAPLDRSAPRRTRTVPPAIARRVRWSRGQRCGRPLSLRCFFAEPRLESPRVRISATLACATGLCMWVLLVAGCGTEGVHERPDQEALRSIATNIVTGEVRTIYIRDRREGSWQMRRYVAEVKVERVDKGVGLKVGDLVFVRYWQREWLRHDRPSEPDGFEVLPREWSRYRILLSRNSFDGFRFNGDGGWNVVGPSGFEPP